MVSSPLSVPSRSKASPPEARRASLFLQWDVREIAGSAAVQGGQQRLVCNRVNFANTVVGQALGVVALKLSYRSSSPLEIWCGMRKLRSASAALTRIR